MVLSRTDEQRLRSLKLANEIRSARARMKRDIRSGFPSAAAVVADPPWFALTMKVGQLLEAIPGWGPVRARRTMRLLGVSEGKTLGGLSVRQRGVLAEYLEERSCGDTQ